MVKLALRIKATFENIEELKPSGPDFRWCLKFVCSNCGEKSDKWNYMSLAEECPAQHGRDTHHFSSKCKLCSRVNTASIIADSIQSYTDEDEGTFKAVVAFDCRGMEPTEFSPREGWIAKAKDGGTEFKDVDLSEGEWVDYCDKIKKSVQISDIEYTFNRIK